MNKLTEKLLSEGYTRENHPDYIEWSNWKDFEYTRQYLAGTVWETPCGLLKKGINSYNHMSHMGIDYCPENNNPRYGCPYYDEKPCTHRIDTKQLWGCNCIYHQTDREYDYEQSVEKLWDERDKIQNEAWQKVTGEYGYCACMKWDRPSRQYKFKYNIGECIFYGCQNEICAITKKQRNLKKVNIYYDILRITKYKIGLLEHEVKRLEKGVKKFEKPIARTDAEIWLKKHKNDFEPKCDREDRINLHFSEYHGKTGFGEYDWFEFTMIPQNIRIERRESRDLLQDLQDAQEGIEVHHASDIVKAEKQAKRERRAKNNAPEKKIKKIIKNIGEDKLLQVLKLYEQGYDVDEIAEMAEVYKSYVYKIIKLDIDENMFKKPEKAEVEQMSLFERGQIS